MLFLNPEFHNLQFEPIVTIITDCKKLIEMSGEEVVDKKDKLKFLEGLKGIVESFLSDTGNQYDMAMEDFKRLVISQVDNDKKYYIGYLIQEFFSRNINWEIVRKYKEKSNCWSKMMRNTDCIKFWNDENSLTIHGLGDNVQMIKSIISRFLGKDLKSVNNF